MRSRRGTTFIPSPNSTLRRDEPDPIRQEFGAVWNAYPMRDDDERTELSGADLSEAAQLDETIFGNTRLVDARGLDACTHDGPSTLDFRTLERYGMLPLVCLRGCGLSERLIEFLPSLLNRPIEFYSCFISYTTPINYLRGDCTTNSRDAGFAAGWTIIKCLATISTNRSSVASSYGTKSWVCCSKDSLTSWWVDNEIETVFKRA